jgi:hypothetical protein
MRVLLAGLISALVGCIQLVVILMIESRGTDERSGLIGGDVAFVVFALLVLTEVICVVALSMYRLSPWILKFLRDDWEACRVANAKRRYAAILQYTTVCAVLLRRVVVMIDTHSFSSGLLLSLCVALVSFLMPLFEDKNPDGLRGRN